MTYKGIKRETTRGLTFDTRQVMSLLNDKVKKKSIIFATRVSKIKKIYYLCVRSAKDHAVVVELVDTLA